MKHSLSREEIAAVLKNGKTLVSENMRVKFAAGEGQKAAIVIPKKGGMTAVMRNTAKRRMRNVFREVFAGAQNTHAVFFLKQGAEKLSYSILRKEVEKTAGKII